MQQLWLGRTRILSLVPLELRLYGVYDSWVKSERSLELLSCKVGENVSGGYDICLIQVCEGKRRVIRKLNLPFDVCDDDRPMCER